MIKAILLLKIEYTKIQTNIIFNRLTQKLNQSTPNYIICSTYNSTFLEYFYFFFELRYNKNIFTVKH